MTHLETGKYAEILLNLPARPLDRPFHYSIPPELAQEAVPGVRVRVPFSGRTIEGILLRRLESAEVENVKGIMDVLDKEPLLSPAMMDLAMWMAEHYLCTRAEALRCVLPTGVRWESTETIAAAPEQMASAQWQLIRQGNSLQSAVLRVLEKEPTIGRRQLEHTLKIASLAPVLRQLEEKGLIERREEEDKGIQIKAVRSVALTQAGRDAAAGDALGRRAPRQAQVLEFLVSQGGTLLESTLRTHLSITSDVFARLEEKGLVIRSDREVHRDPYGDHDFPATQDLVLNDKQAAALSALEQSIDQRQAQTFLLHGVTGSGKTEVYLQAIRYAREKKLQSIVLVPEIALTPQTVERFKSRFGNEVAVLHSRLSAGERYDQWRQIRAGNASIVVGARSALFAPFSRLGLIIIDEEHETSYKQSDNPKYHARDAAWKRCQLENAVLLLGSATPAVDTFYRAQQGEITVLNLPERVTGENLPPVTIVDMRQELKEGNRNPFSRTLQEEIRRNLAERRQSIIFLNRRGFSTFVLCRECGLVLRCPHCDVSLTYHARSQKMECHYCMYTEKTPDVCPRCQSHHIRYFGIGTERVEEEAQKLFPGIRVLRMDMDTTGRRGAHERILSAFRSGKADMLVGTQMIAKGLDFEKVGLVGVITADTALNFPDYIAGERTFQLMTQVAGRAGRGTFPGTVVIQTYSPDHYSIRLAKTHDYIGFYQEEIKYREQLHYPPFARAVSLLVWADDEKAVVQTAETIGSHILQAIGVRDDFQLLGPVPALLGRIRQNYRWQMHLLGYGSLHPGEFMRSILGDLYALSRQAGVKISLDVDPLGLA